MRYLLAVAAVAIMAGCVTDPETRAAKARADMFEDCMDDSTPRYGPVVVATAEQKRKAAETCGAIVNGK